MKDCTCFLHVVGGISDIGLVCLHQWYRFPPKNLLLSSCSATCQNWDRCCISFLSLASLLVLCHGLCGFVVYQQPCCHQLWQSHDWPVQSVGQVSFGTDLWLQLCQKVLQCIYTCLSLYWRLWEREGFNYLLVPISLFAVADCHNTSICQYMCNIFRCSKVIGLSSDCLVQICWV